MATAESKVSFVNEGTITFAVNGEKKVIAARDIDSSITLNDYIRRFTPFKGTKLSCGEGGCGACAVRLSRYDAITQRVVTISVNSCLRPLATLDGWAVTTTEGLGNSQTGLHPIQERIAGMNGTQCGFCTPGMVMATHVALVQAGSAGLTMEELEARYDGNICRCTGYRPILDAAKSFARDTDIEDMVCKTTKIGAIDSSRDPVFPSWLNDHKATPLRCQGSNGTVWIRPVTLSGVFDAFASHPVASEVKLVVANTSIGIYKEEAYRVFIDISNIPELLAVSTSTTGITLGASVTLDGLMAALKTVTDPIKSSSYEAINRHIWKIANVHVRSIGSIGGNLCLAKTRGFLSDLATVLIGAEATVTLLAPGNHTRVISLLEFVSTPTWTNREILLNITIPYNIDGDRYNSYKVALRSTNAHAFINGAFKFNVDSKTNTIRNPVLAYGGVMEYDIAGAHPIRASRTEAYLTGRTLSQETLQGALKLLNDEVQPKGERAEYRQRLVGSYFYKFFLSLLNDEAKSSSVRSASSSVQRTGISRARQQFVISEESKPVGASVPKLGGTLQASGEAQYIDDIPSPSDVLYAAYVLSTAGAARIVSIDTKEALSMPGVARFVGAKDVPGINEWSLFPWEKKPLFAAENVAYYGQPIGLILADTLRHAEVAAKRVRVTYDDEGKKPIVGIAAAREAKSFWMSKETKTGPDPEPLLRADKHYASGKVQMGGQHHMYLETQVAFAIPEEEGKLTLWCANQGADSVQNAAATALGIPAHKVDVRMRRIGGGFGGKCIIAVQHACAAAVAAIVTKRPIKFPLDRETDFTISGGREEMELDYEVAFNNEGKISAIKANGTIDSGDTFLISSFAALTIGGSLNQVYHIPSLHVTVGIAKTNSQMRAPVRGPAEPEASYAMETILDHVAHITRLDRHVVRQNNFFSLLPEDAAKLVSHQGTPISHYTVPEMWTNIQRKYNHSQRTAAVATFNAANRWKKRGMAMTPCRYHVRTSMGASTLVNIYGDGSVIVHTTGAEIGQGLHTKVAQVVSHALGSIFGEGGRFVPMDKIRIADFSTNALPNSGFTGGSVTSEKCAEAGRRAAITIVERMKPVYDHLVKTRDDEIKKNGGEPKPIAWEALIGACIGASINLSAESRYRGFGGNPAAGLPAADFVAYQNYGAAIAEIELDVLTGEVNIAQADILYDAGKSLNPAIDIGQVEGSFIMGLGFLLREEVKFDANTGRLLTGSTWSYKPPGNRDVPAVWNVELIENTKFDTPGNLHGSKATGEPPLVLANSVIMAVRDAVTCARRDAGLTDYFPLNVPATPEQLQRLCAADTNAFTIGAPSTAAAAPSS